MWLLQMLSFQSAAAGKLVGQLHMDDPAAWKNVL